VEKQDPGLLPPAYLNGPCCLGKLHNSVRWVGDRKQLEQKHSTTVT
jgi:hypothetical protein